MPTDQNFIDHILDQLSSLENVRIKAMFGGHTLYCDDKVVGLICDNQFFVKPTDAGREFIGNVTEAPAYEGAKNSFLIEDLDDRAWLSQLIRITAETLPKPKPKKKTSHKQRHT